MVDAVLFAFRSCGDTTTKAAATDERIVDKAGNVYFEDLEDEKIHSRKPDGSIHTLVEGDKVRGADTFSIYDNHLNFPNLRLPTPPEKF
ncbi:MAG: hypothetical protein ABI618_07950 [Nitrospirota bacterium]